MGLTEEQVRAFFRGERRPGVTTAAPRPVPPPTTAPRSQVDQARIQQLYQGLTTMRPEQQDDSARVNHVATMLAGGVKPAEVAQVINLELQRIETAMRDSTLPQQQRASLGDARAAYTEMLANTLEEAPDMTRAGPTPAARPQAMQQDTLDEADVRRFFRGEPAPTTAPKEGFLKRYTSGPLNRGARAPQGMDPLQGREFDVDPVTGLPQHSTEKVTKELYPQIPIGAAQGLANVGSAFSNIIYKMNPPEFMRHMVPSPEQATEVYRGIGNILPAESPEAITGRTLGRLGSEGMMLSKFAGAARGFLPSTMNPILSRALGLAASTPVSAAIGAGQQESSTAGFLSEMMPQNEWLRGVAEDPSKRGAFEAGVDVVTSIPFELIGVGPELNAWKRAKEAREALEASAKIPRLPPGAPPSYPRTDIGSVGSAQHAAQRNIGIQDLLDQINKPPQTLEEVRAIEEIMRNAQAGPVTRDVTGAVIPPPQQIPDLSAARAQSPTGRLEVAGGEELPGGFRMSRAPDVPVARTQPYSTAQDVGADVQQRTFQLGGEARAQAGPPRPAIVPPPGPQPGGTPSRPIIEERAEPVSYSQPEQTLEDQLRALRRSGEMGAGPAGVDPSPVSPDVTTLLQSLRDAAARRANMRQPGNVLDVVMGRQDTERALREWLERAQARVRGRTEPRVQPERERYPTIQPTAPPPERPPIVRGTDQEPPPYPPGTKGELPTRESHAAAGAPGGSAVTAGETPKIIQPTTEQARAYGTGRLLERPPPEGPPPEEPPPPTPAPLPPKGPAPAAGGERPRFSRLPDPERKALVDEFMGGESNPEGGSFNWWLENVKGITPRGHAEAPRPEAEAEHVPWFDQEPPARRVVPIPQARQPLRSFDQEPVENLKKYYDDLIEEYNAHSALEEPTENQTARQQAIDDILDELEEALEARGVDRIQYSKGFAESVADDESEALEALRDYARVRSQAQHDLTNPKIKGKKRKAAEDALARAERQIEGKLDEYERDFGSDATDALAREAGIEGLARGEEPLTPPAAPRSRVEEQVERANKQADAMNKRVSTGAFTRAENVPGELGVPQAKLHGQLVKKKDKLAKATTEDLQRYITDLEREFGDLNDLELAGPATELEAAVLKRRIREVEQTMDNVEQVLGARDVAAPEPAARQPESTQPTSRRLTPSILEQIDDEELEELFQEYSKEADAIHRKPPWTRTKEENARQEFLDHQRSGIRMEAERRKNRPIRRDEPTEQARREYDEDDLDFDRDEVVAELRTHQKVMKLAQEQLAKTKLGKGARRNFQNDMHRATQTIDGQLHEYADKFGDDAARSVAREAGIPEEDWPDRLRLEQEDLPAEPGRAPFVDAEGKPRDYAKEPETTARAEEDPLTDYTEDAPLPRTKKNAEAGGYDFEYNGKTYTIFYSPAMKRWSEVTPQGNVQRGVTKDETMRRIMDDADDRVREPGEEKKPRTQRMTASRRQKKIDDLHTRWAEQMRQLWTENEANSWSRGRVSQASKRVNVIEDELRTLGAELPDTDVVVWREMQRAIAADEAATRFGLNERVADELRRIEELPDDELLRLSEAADSKAKQANPESLLRRAAYAGEAKKRGLIESRPGHVDKELLRLLGTSSLSGIVGAGIGANIDDEDRSRGALVGALTAMAAHAGVVGAGKSPSVRSFMRDWFKSGGDVPEEVWRAREGRDARRAVFELDYKKRLAEFRHALRGLNIPKEQITAVLQGGAMPKTWPKSVQEAVTGMRADIDAFSQRGIDEDLYIGPMAETVELGKGKYTSRAYQLFSDPRWEGKVTDKMRAEAAAALKQEHPEWDANRIKAEIESMTRGEDDFYRPGGGRTMGAQDVTTLKSRSQMLERQPALRRLMGEHTDPEIVYTQTMERLGDLLENQQFQQEVLKAGAGKWLFLDKEPGHVHKIEGLRQGSPLQGRYTTQRIKERFKEVLPEMQQETHPVWREIQRINAVSKFGKTVGSVSTQITNFVSNSLVAMANGHINPKTFVTGVQQVRKNTARYRRYVELHVAGDAPHAGELREMQTQLAQSAKSKTGKIVAGGIEKLARKPIALATTAYRLGDEFWKINGFESNLKDLRKAYPKKPIDELEREAAEITRQTYHTYSRAPRAIQFLRKIPVLGAFPTFSAETARTMKNIVKQIHKEWQTPATRFIAVKRFAGLMAAAAAPYALAETSRAAFGVSKQEDADNRRYLSPFQRNNDLLYLPFKDKDGKQKYIDISRMDPYQYLRNVPNALMRGADKGSKVEDISIGLARPFLGIEPLAQSLVEAASNKKLRRGGYGGPVYNETSSFLKRQAKKIGHVGKALTPEVLKQGYAVAKAPFDEKTTVVGEGSNMLGLRIRDTDFGQGMTFKARDADKDLLASQNAFIARLADDNNVSDAVLRQTYRRMDRSRRRTFDALSRDVRAAQRSGIDETVIREKLQGLRFSRAEADALLDRSYIPYQISDQKIDQLLDEATNDAQYDRLQQRFEVMREEFERASGN